MFDETSDRQRKQSNLMIYQTHHEIAICMSDTPTILWFYDRSYGDASLRSSCFWHFVYSVKFLFNFTDCLSSIAMWTFYRSDILSRILSILQNVDHGDITEELTIYSLCDSLCLVLHPSLAFVRLDRDSSMRERLTLVCTGEQLIR